MRRQLLWLLPILVFAALTGLSPAASAHPGHTHEECAQPAHGEASQQEIVQVASVADAPCGCPAGHCGCGIDCPTHCADGIAVFDLSHPRQMRGPNAFMPGHVTRIAEWVPRADYDPPRRSA